MEIECIIIEDEYPAQEKLLDFVSQVPFLKLLGVYDNAIAAMECLAMEQIDIVFLDIQMPKINGIQFLETLTIMPQVIIVSAFENYAIRGYEFNVTDYLLKPYSFERFMQAVEKATNIYKQKNEKLQLTKTLEHDVLFVKSGNNIEKVDVNEIYYVQGMKDYQMIVAKKSKIMALQTFIEISKVLREPDFVRIHKSYIIALSKIDRIERNRVNINGQLLPISNTYKEHFNEVLKNNKHLF